MAEREAPAPVPAFGGASSSPAPAPAAHPPLPAPPPGPPPLRPLDQRTPIRQGETIHRFIDSIAVPTFDQPKIEEDDSRARWLTIPSLNLT